jgi:hypothetical protein
MTAAIPRISAIDRQRCRWAFDQRFSVERMALDYLRVYEQAMSNTYEREAEAPSFDSWPTVSTNA